LSWPWPFRKPRRPYRPAAARDGKPGPAVLFVHGLGGSPTTSWGRMFDVCARQEAFSSHTLDCYAFPTALFPLARQMPRLQALAQGLATELELRHSGRTDLTLVGHSLGGLVARQYVLNKLKVGKNPIASRLLLYAVPNTGAALAQLGSLFSWRGGHLRQLRRDADILDLLNDDWARLDVEAHFPVHYVIAGRDGVVSAQSAMPFFGQDNVSMLTWFNHRSITQAIDADDIRYAVLQKFALPHLQGNVNAPQEELEEAIPLFETYAKVHQPYYLARLVDQTLKTAMFAGHVWLSGTSGIGKTTALMYCALSQNWNLQPIQLGSYRSKSALDLLSAMGVELASSQQSAERPSPQAEEAELITFFRQRLRDFAADRVTVVLIEEMPLDPGPEFSVFLRLILHLSLAIAADGATRGRILLAFSTIHDPRDYISSGIPKIRQHIQFMKLAPWQRHEIRGLIDRLAPIFRPDLDPADRELIAEAAKGSPRYVKLLFQHWQNRTAEGFTLAQLLEIAAAEQV
jgi:pimeloyl-ACP methyl ester carboxylesterase